MTTALDVLAVALQVMEAGSVVTVSASSEAIE